MLPVSKETCLNLLLMGSLQFGKFLGSSLCTQQEDGPSWATQALLPSACLPFSVLFCKAKPGSYFSASIFSPLSFSLLLTSPVGEAQCKRPPWRCSVLHLWLGSCAGAVQQQEVRAQRSREGFEPRNAGEAGRSLWVGQWSWLQHSPSTSPQKQKSIREAERRKTSSGFSKALYYWCTFTIWMGLSAAVCSEKLLLVP